MALLLGNDADMAEWIGEALAVPGEVDPDLRTIAEALHVVPDHDPAAEGTAAGTAAAGTARPTPA